jgi:acyl carrier protein
MPDMTESEVFDKFAQIVAKSLRIDASQIAPDTHLTDLGAESLDLIEITMETETQFHIFLPDKSILETAVEVFGPAFWKKMGISPKTVNGSCCAACRKQTRMAFEGEVAVKDLQHYFLKVGTWVRMIQGPGAVHASGMRVLWRPHGGLHGLSHEVREVRPGDHFALRGRDQPRMGPRVLR